jgi:cell division septal protein FtsQ
MVHWLKGRRRNRRFGEREYYLLDVKLRATQARTARLRVLGVFVAVVLSLAAAWRGGQWLLDCLIYKNEAFAIQQIEVETDGVLNSETIRRWAMARTGQNLMALDLARVQRNLEIQPPIQFAAVERVLPHTLKLSVTEREPVAQTLVTLARAGGGADQYVYDFDEDGYTLQPLDPRWRTAPPPAGERLPILVDVAAGDVPLGRQTESPQIRGALQLISEFDHSPMAGMAELQSINVAVPEILQVTTSQGAQITFSLNHFDAQLRRWRLIYDQYQKWGRAITWLDLSIANNLPVRSVALNGAPPLPPLQPGQPPRTKKKHV